MTTTTKRSKARANGLRLAAKVATVGGFAVAALGLAEAHAAGTNEMTTHAATSEVAATHDDTQPLPMEGWAKVQNRGGDCGCSPCWGPPAPPPRGVA